MQGLNAMRRRAGISAAQLAARMQVTRQTVYQWESGQCWPSSRDLPQIAEALGCTIDELYNDYTAREDG